MSLKHDSQIVTQKNCINGYRKICINGYRISCGSRRRMKDDYGLWAWEGMSGHPTLQTPQWVQKFWRYFNKETYWFLIDDMPCDSDYIWDGHPRYRGPNNAGRTGIWYGYLYFCYYFADFCPFVLVEKSKGRSVKDKRLRLKVNVSIFNLTIENSCTVQLAKLLHRISLHIMCGLLQWIGLLFSLLSVTRIGLNGLYY